jgi:excinuclease ABC subunit C
MQLILTNLRTYIEKNHEPALDELKIVLRLKRLPYIIDCFDISNFGNDFAVGACTRFMNGVPDKSGYRKFKIKKVSQQNDFLMMEEIIRRRYSSDNIAEDVPADKRIDRFPDLIVIDGGKGHLSTAITTLKNIGIEEIDCVSLAKENEEVYTISSTIPILIPRNKKSLRILQHIRDESHRFGLTYNRYLRKKMLSH